MTDISTDIPHTSDDQQPSPIVKPYKPESSIRSEQNPFEVSVDLLRQSAAIIYHYQYDREYIPTAYEMQAMRNLCGLLYQMKNDIIEACRQLELRYLNAPET